MRGRSGIRPCRRSRWRAAFGLARFAGQIRHGGRTYWPGLKAGLGRFAGHVRHTVAPAALLGRTYWPGLKAGLALALLTGCLAGRAAPPAGASAGGACPWTGTTKSLSWGSAPDPGKGPLALCTPIGLSYPRMTMELHRQIGVLQPDWGSGGASSPSGVRGEALRSRMPCYPSTDMHP